MASCSSIFAWRSSRDRGARGQAPGPPRADTTGARTLAFQVWICQRQELVCTPGQFTQEGKPSHSWLESKACLPAGISAGHQLAVITAGSNQVTEISRPLRVNTVACLGGHLQEPVEKDPCVLARAQAHRLMRVLQLHALSVKHPSFSRDSRETPKAAQPAFPGTNEK